jgi:predicted GH43/DUF377 family glycosyl hydrolase
VNSLDEIQNPENVIPSVVLDKNEPSAEPKKPAAADFILDKLGEVFTYGELMKCLEKAIKDPDIKQDQIKVINQMLWLASAHYEINFSIDSAISERVIFPVSATEQKGIEDARFVKFTEDNGDITYYATYTAYDGMTILPKLISTKDFYNFKILPINGEIAQNKGMALFPRKVNGKFAMLCRIEVIVPVYNEEEVSWSRIKGLKR